MLHRVYYPPGPLPRVRIIPGPDAPPLQKTEPVPDPDPKELVLLTFTVPDGRMTEEQEEAAFDNFEITLDDDLKTRNLGHVDGMDRGADQLSFYLYGPVGNKIWERVQHHLNQIPLPLTSATRRPNWDTEPIPYPLPNQTR